MSRSTQKAKRSFGPGVLNVAGFRIMNLVNERLKPNGGNNKIGPLTISLNFFPKISGLKNFKGVKISPLRIILKVDLRILLIGPYQHLGPRYYLFYWKD
jgi:hypothetical protein